MYDAWFSKPVPVAFEVFGEIKPCKAGQAVDLLTWRSAGSPKHLAMFGSFV